MLKHGRAGVPMEVMGLMLGEFVDDYTVRVIDVFAMPQSGTVSIGSLLKTICIRSFQIITVFKRNLFLVVQGCSALQLKK